VVLTVTTTFKSGGDMSPPSHTKVAPVISPTHDPTQPTKKLKISTQPDPTHESIQPMDNSGTVSFETLQSVNRLKIHEAN